MSARLEAVAPCGSPSVIGMVLACKTGDGPTRSGRSERSGSKRGPIFLFGQPSSFLPKTATKTRAKYPLFVRSVRPDRSHIGL